MAAQPLNTEIKVYRTVRSYRQADRHESVAALIKRLRPLVMSIPTEETLVVVETRDTNTTDMSPYMGEARHNAGRGFPIVIGLRGAVSFGNAQTNMASVDFGFQIGSDWFLKETVDAVDTADLHAEAQALTEDLV